MAGTTSAAFLKIGVGARAVAMGEAYVAVADDVDAIYWNPAGLIQLKKHEITTMHNEWFQNIRYEYVGYVYPFGTGRTAGISLGLLYMSDIEKRTWLGETPETQPQSYESLFGASDFAGTLSYSQWLSYRLMGGINAKFIYEKIDVYNAYDVAFDIGLLYKTGIDTLNLGLNIQNLGPKIKFRERGFFLPINAKLGASYKITDWDLLLALDLNQSIDNYLKIHTGAEYWFMDMVAVRGGYRYKWYGNDLGVLSGLTAGIGLKISNIFNSAGIHFDAVDLQLDYAFVPYGDLGLTHRISLTGKFGIPVELCEPEKPKDEELVKKAELLELKQEIFKDINTKIDSLSKEISSNISLLLNKTLTSINVLKERLDKVDELKDEIGKIKEEINLLSKKIEEIITELKNKK